MAEEQKQPTAEAIPEPQQPTAQEIPEPQQPAAQPMESQVTSKTPATKPAKNPKRVEAGKRVAEKTRLAREAHKKAYDEKMAQEREKKETAPAPAPEPETEPKPAAADSEGFTTNQWLTIVGIGAGILTTYVKRDDIKNFFGKEKMHLHLSRSQKNQLLYRSHLNLEKEFAKWIDFSFEYIFPFWYNQTK